MAAPGDRPVGCACGAPSHVAAVGCPLDVSDALADTAPDPLGRPNGAPHRYISAYQSALGPSERRAHTGAHCAPDC